MKDITLNEEQQRCLGKTVGLPAVHWRHLLCGEHPQSREQLRGSTVWLGRPRAEARAEATERTAAMEAAAESADKMEAGAQDFKKMTKVMLWNNLIP